MNSTSYRKLFKQLSFTNTLYTNVYLFTKSDDCSVGKDDKLKLEVPEKRQSLTTSRNMNIHKLNTF